ncbi:hypothetical protein GF326_03890 [Candidatus Bathyarchaeota archaeon]|nr:hypothetical protein [Candidatus Bathyarchaeota archaeon]
MNAKKLVILTLLMLTTTQTIYVSLCGHPNKLTSAWLTNSVYIDGDVTDSKEWIDANSMELKIGTNYGRSPPFLETEIWAKNDMTHLYLLYRIKYPFTEYDLDDKAFIYYLIPDTNGGYIVSDKSVVAQLGATEDLFNYTGSYWQNDLPGGENNVEGRGHYDGLFYWFEIKKPLNSGDTRDWLFEHEESYGYANSPIDISDHLCEGLIDDSKGYSIQTFIQIKIAKSTLTNHIAVGGELVNTSKREILKQFIYKILIYLVTLITCIVVIKKLL